METKENKMSDILIRDMKMPKTPLLVCIYPNGICSDEEGMIYRAIPAADVRPVQHARWIYKVEKIYHQDGSYSFGEYYPICSECKVRPKGDNESNYCPNCGARMEER